MYYPLIELITNGLEEYTTQVTWKVDCYSELWPVFAVLLTRLIHEYVICKGRQTDSEEVCKKKT